MELRLRVMKMHTGTGTGHPIGIAGKRCDRIGTNGTGKTAAFLLPLIDRMLSEPHNAHSINALVIVPTGVGHTDRTKPGGLSFFRYELHRCIWRR